MEQETSTQETKEFRLTETLVNKILNYIATRPLGEVLEMFDNLRTELSAQSTKE